MVGLRNKLYVGALVTGLATLIGCGGGEKVDARTCGRQMLYEKLTPNAREALNNAFYNRVQHGRCKCRPQELSAVLMKAAYADGIPDNEITYDEIKFFVDQELKNNQKRYAGSLLPEDAKEGEEKAE